MNDPSAWVVRHLAEVPVAADVLDVACGSGRHARFLLDRGHRVTAVDRDVSGVADLAGHPRLGAVERDLEDGRPFPEPGREFAAVIVVNYLHRPLLPRLVEAVGPGGALIYETFARGNERFGRPRRPAFLLEPGELLEAVVGRLRVLSYENAISAQPRPAAVQRICAVRR